MRVDPEAIAMLSDSARRYAAARYSFAHRRAIMLEPAGCSLGAWRDYAELGWLAVCLPEARGGLDANPEAIGALMDVVGSHLLMEPVLASAVIGTRLLVKAASAAQRARLLPSLADGSLKLCVAWKDESSNTRACVMQRERLTGTVVGVLHGDMADRFIVQAQAGAGSTETALVLVDAAATGVSRTSYRLVDGRGAATLTFEGAPVEPLIGDARIDCGAVVSETIDEAAVALCAEASGIVRTLIEATADYLKTRIQFGRPIGANQALQHRMAELYMLRHEIEALTSGAQSALSAPTTQRTRFVSGARAYIAGAARRVANEAVQMHGGVGVTEELQISHYFRRLMVNSALFGNRDHHFRRFLDATWAADHAAGSIPVE
jgi:alkylation response protein AidB-like acyl-CoA dehydrogenase